MLREVVVRDLTMRVLDAGSGQPFLFVHGFPLDHTMWRDQIEEFKTSHRVIAPDLRGFGGSRTARQAGSLKAHADDLAELLMALGISEPIIYCGLSMGGLIAWDFCKHYAHAVERLILCDTRSKGDSPEVAAGRQAMAERIRKEGSAFVPEILLPKLLAPTTPRDQPEVFEHTQRMIRSTEPETIAATQIVLADRADMTAELSSVSYPTLAICGEHDAITPPDEMVSMAAAMPAAKLVRIPGCGHMAPLEKPVEVNRAIQEFLRG